MSHSIESLAVAQSSEESARIALLDKAQAAIEQATGVPELKEIIDQAHVLEIYAQKVEASEILARRCVEIKLRAERKAGELVRQLVAERNWSTHPEEGQNQSGTLASVGVTKSQSHVWQHIAALPDDTFNMALAEGKSESELVRMAKIVQREAEPQPEPTGEEQPKPPPIPTLEVTFDEIKVILGMSIPGNDRDMEVAMKLRAFVKAHEPPVEPPMDLIE